MITSRARSRTVAVSVAVLALTGSMAAAYAAAGRDSSVQTISACVSVKTGVMRLETTKAPCRTHAPRSVRERRVTWNEQGVPGLDGGTGADGATGPAGPAGPSGPAGAQGLPGADGHDGTAGSNGTPGANGAPGTNGVDGASFLSGDGAPDEGLGNDGDTYLDLTNGDVYTRSGDSWTASGSLLGTPGSNGEDGSDGASLLSGTGAPGDGLGSNGDTYLNLTNGDVYTKSGGSWTAGGSLLGPAGSDGAPGAGATFLATGGTAPVTAFVTTTQGVSPGIAVLPLQGAASLSTNVTTVGAAIDGTSTTASGLAQVIPQDMTITSISGAFTTSGGLSLGSKQLTLKAQLYSAASNSNSYSPVASAVCTMPTQTGTVTSGKVLACQTSALTIAVTAGTKTFMVLSISVTGGSGLTSLTGYASTTVTAN